MIVGYASMHSGLKMIKRVGDPYSAVVGKRHKIKYQLAEGRKRKPGKRLLSGLPFCIGNAVSDSHQGRATISRSVVILPSRPVTLMK